MRYYITGSSGFIGKRVIDFLKAMGEHQVCEIVRPIKEMLGILPDIEPFVFIHLSAYGNHYNQRSITEIIDRNIRDLWHVLAFCQAPNCETLFNISTSSIQLPRDTLYSCSKRFGELMIESCSDPRFRNVRPYSVYGPGEAEHRLIPKIIRALHSGEKMIIDEQAAHDWIHVDDFITAMFQNYRKIGTGISTPNIEIVRMLEEISGKQLNYEAGSVRVYDTRDWKSPDPVLSHRSLYDGLKQTYQYYAGVK